MLLPETPQRLPVCILYGAVQGLTAVKGTPRIIRERDLLSVRADGGIERRDLGNAGFVGLLDVAIETRLPVDVELGGTRASNSLWSTSAPRAPLTVLNDDRVNMR